MSKHTQGPWAVIGPNKYLNQVVIGIPENGVDPIACAYGAGEELAANAKLIAAAPELLRLLGVMFDAYENGPTCYEDPEEFAGPLGNAVQLDDADFHKIADLLNELDPRA